MTSRSDLTVRASDVRETAGLARLRLSDDDIALHTQELQSVLHLADVLDDVDTTGSNPLHMLHAITAPPRADIPSPSLSPADALRNAPQLHDHFFRVPKML